MQIHRKRRGLVSRPLQGAGNLVEAAGDAVGAAPGGDGEDILDLFERAVEIVSAEPGGSEVQASQAQLTEATLLRWVGFVELDGVLGVAFGVGAARWAAQPESRGGGVAGLLGHREGEHPAGVVVAPDLLAGLRRAGESVLGGALVAQPGVGAGFYGGESDPGGTGLGNVAPAVDLGYSYQRLGSWFLGVGIVKVPLTWENTGC